MMESVQTKSQTILAVSMPAQPMRTARQEIKRGSYLPQLAVDLREHKKQVLRQAA